MKKLISILGSLVLTFAFVSAASANVIQNGSFESPEVTSGSHWQISNAVDSWYSDTTPDPGDPVGLELQENGLFAGVTAQDGFQWTELDAYYPLKIYQTVDACPSGEYQISFYYAPRPGVANSQLLAKLGDTTLLNTGVVASSVPFVWISYSGQTTGPNTGTVQLSFTEIGPNDQLGMFLDNVSLECVAPVIVRSAEITAPTAGEHVSGLVNITAYLFDDDLDTVQWAVRPGTCTSGAPNVWGNVDGHNDPFTWIHDGANTQNFSTTPDTSSWTEGLYCFVFNPTEDSGESEIRLTREFYIDDPDDDNDGILDGADNCPLVPNANQADLDGDGIGDACDDDVDGDSVLNASDNCPLNSNSDQANLDGDGLGDLCDDDVDGDSVSDTEDMCLRSVADDPSEDQGVNRWIWDGNSWKTVLPKTKEVTPSSAPYDTYGCSCTQILEKLKAAGLGEFGGHYKFGCSKSILEDFNKDMSDGVLDGKYFIETVKVDSKKTTDTLSSLLINGTSYLLKVYGTWTNSNNVADAEYISKDGWSTFLNGYDIFPYFLGEGAFDLEVDNVFVDWGTYNVSHEYTLPYTGTGNPAKFLIFDGDSNSGPTAINMGWYLDNSGSLFVDIYGQL